jgi:2-keto-myo-inositol isomerase
MTTLSFALNHMTAPALSPDAFFNLAKSLGISAVEIRNDLDGNAIIDGTPATEIKALAEKHGLTIISINALQRFNQWNDARAREAHELITYARDVQRQGAGSRAGQRWQWPDRWRAADQSSRSAHCAGTDAERGWYYRSRRATWFRHLLAAFQNRGVEGIRAVSGENTFKIVHDTFHHYLAGEEKFHPEMTGLVHISGVADPGITVRAMRDPHRILVDAADRLDNAGQMRRLREGGYIGPFSFEPFSPEVHQSTDIKAAVRKSMQFLTAKA